MKTIKTDSVVTHTPNGREIREVAEGVFEVQPHNDNYWIRCSSVQEAMYRFHFPSGDPTARRIAELIVGSWESQWSIDETARVGVAEEDQEAAEEFAAGDSSLASSIVREIENICRERAAI